ncbi:MAG: hypothetical protein QUV06_07575 [Cyanobium sp. CZS 48M]|nr:hypothetical protein [Cyanobium sp. CZS48M]
MWLALVTLTTLGYGDRAQVAVVRFLGSARVLPEWMTSSVNQLLAISSFTAGIKASDVVSVMGPMLRSTRDLLA